MAALDAAGTVCDLPMMCSLTLEADGTALFGGSAVEAVVALQEMGGLRRGAQLLRGAGPTARGGGGDVPGGPGAG